MSMLFPDFMDRVSLTRIARGDVGALKASVDALDARIAGQVCGDRAPTQIEAIRIAKASRAPSSAPAVESQPAESRD
jgi:hypothetical protein